MRHVDQSGTHQKSLRQTLPDARSPLGVLNAYSDPPQINQYNDRWVWPPPAAVNLKPPSARQEIPRLREVDILCKG